MGGKQEHGDRGPDSQESRVWGGAASLSDFRKSRTVLLNCESRVPCAAGPGWRGRGSASRSRGVALGGPGSVQLWREGGAGSSRVFGTGSWWPSWMLLSPVSLWGPGWKAPSGLTVSESWTV